ncbi:MAG: tetratricopeptide repeat protein [Verrucomicrobiales bacterium]|nr:tetratricopeptide repeat protein [Verrucomicrobiales bacterium]
MTGFLRWIGGVVVGLALLAGVFWVLRSAWRQSEDRPSLAIRWALTLANLAFLVFVLGPMVAGDGGGSLVGAMATALFAGSLIGLSGLIMAVLWSPSICDAVGKRIARLFDGGDTPPDPEPLLSVAEARRKQGRYAEAEAEVRRQLERFPGSFRAQMLLAEIQVADRRDLAAATTTITELVNEPGHAPKNIAFALTWLAEWHLKLTADRDGARAILEQILVRLPDSPEAHLARQRIAHLTPAQMLAEARARPRIEVPKSEERLGLLGETPKVQRRDSDPQELAARLVAQLDAFPEDNRTREELAVLYAEGFQRPDLAVEQLEQLVAQPLAPATDVVRWLNLEADILLGSAAGLEPARQALQRIVDRDPAAPAAENARRRLVYIQRQAQGKKQSQVLRLGSYEQRLGLKGSPNAPEAGGQSACPPHWPG